MNKFICKDCGAFAMYAEKWDSYYCHPCNKWLEANCNDPKCEYCHKRPETPSTKVQHD